MRSSFLPDWLFEHAALRPEAPALATPSLRLSYGDLADRVRALSAWLHASGIAAGDRVAVALPNLPATVVAGLAIGTLGATSVELARDWGPASLADALRRSRPRQAFVATADVTAWAALDVPLERLWAVGPAPPDGRDLPFPLAWLRPDGTIGAPAGAAPPAPPPPRRRDLDAPALVLFTSGSTGRPRGVVQTFRNLDANTRSIVEYLGLSAADRALLVLPLYYCYGRSVLQTHLYCGGSVFLDHRFAFPHVVLEALAAEECTGFAGVPATFELLRRQGDLSPLHLPRLRYLTQAGGPMSPGTIAWVRRTFAPASLYVMYGQTEATARLAWLPPERAADKAGSIGVAIPGVELRVVGDDGVELPADATGQLVARGDNVTPGYLDEPEETAAILHDGWLWTGDLARRDREGFLFLEGRAKEILKISGYRVSPVEIEHLLARHPGVAEAGVIGAPDPVTGEAAIAFVVPRGEPPPAEVALLRFCRDELPLYKVPARVIRVDRLPRNEAGKLLRAELAKWWTDQGA